MINVRDASDRAYPTGTVFGSTINRAGVRLSGTRVLPPGRYVYRVGYQRGSTWVNVGSVQSFTVAKPAAPQPGNWVMGYYVGYLKDQLPLDAVEWDAMTHIAVGAAVPRADGSLDTRFYHHTEAEGRAWAKSVVDRAHSRGRKAIMMIGGASSRAAFASAASPANRARFVEQITSAAADLGFDGVDIDWEPMIASDGPHAVALGQALKARRPGLLLTIPVMPVNTNLPQSTLFPTIPQLAQTYDQLNVMSYGMTGGWDGWASWHSSALSGSSPTTPMSVESSVNAYLGAGVPARKLGVGIGFFGSCMTGTTAPRQMNQGMRILADDNEMSFRNIMSTYYRKDLARWDDVAKVPYLSSPTPIGPAGCTYVTYEDQRSIAAKAAYARSKGLGGTIIWNINEVDKPVQTYSVSGSGSLMTAVRDSFLR